MQNDATHISFYRLRVRQQLSSHQQVNCWQAKNQGVAHNGATLLPQIFLDEIQGMEM